MNDRGNQVDRKEEREVERRQRELILGIKTLEPSDKDETRPDEPEVVEDNPSFEDSDGQDTDVDYQDIGHETDEVVRTGREQKRRQESAKNSENCEMHGPTQDTQDCRKDGHQEHQEEGESLNRDE